MPIHLPPISRRRFLTGSLAVGAGWMSSGWLHADETGRRVDPHRLALLSDTHVDADPATIVRDINMADHLRQAVAEVLKLEAAPARVLVNGDFAYSSGQSGDYASGVDLLRPLREAGMPVHIGLGNHDHRERFLVALPAEHEPTEPVENKYVSLVALPRANWLILDSLNVTKETRGALGPGQLDWLAKTLDAHANTPAVVMVHHHPELALNAKPSGIADTAALLDALSPRKQAKALVFGHTHRWRHERRPDGLHLVNLPATAYVFADKQPSGWVDARLEETGATLELRTLDPQHAWQGQKLALEWRT